MGYSSRQVNFFICNEQIASHMSQQQHQKYHRRSSSGNEQQQQQQQSAAAAAKTWIPARANVSSDISELLRVSASCSEVDAAPNAAHALQATCKLAHMCTCVSVCGRRRETGMREKHAARAYLWQ